MFRAIWPPGLDGLAADMNAKPARLIGRPAAHPAFHLWNRFENRLLNHRRRRFGRLFRLRNAPLKIKPMRLADNGISRHATHFFGYLTRGMSFRPQISQSFYAFRSPMHHAPFIAPFPIYRVLQKQDNYM